VLNLGFHLPDRLLGQVTQLGLGGIAGMPVGKGQPESTGGGGRFLFAAVGVVDEPGIGNRPLAD
jgi:hypothetical protein